MDGGGFCDFVALAVGGDDGAAGGFVIDEAVGRVGRTPGGAVA